MLNNRSQLRQFGFSLIEMLVGVVILSVLATVALPYMAVWNENTRIRNATESITNGLQRARTEAVRRNSTVEFVLDVDTSWLIRIAGASDVIETRSAGEGSKDVALVSVDIDGSDANTITYNNFGSVRSPNGDGSLPLAQVDVDLAGENRNLRVVIGTSGEARMCDPRAEAGSLTAC